MEERRPFKCVVRAVHEETKSAAVQLSPGCEQLWGKPGRHVEGDGDILMSTSSLQNARLGRWKQVRGLREDRVPRRRGAV